MQAAHAALQEEHERLLQKSAKAGEMQDAVQVRCKLQIETCSIKAAA